MARIEDTLGGVEGFAHRIEHLLHHEHHDAPQPAAAPAVPHNETGGTNMSLYTELASDARALAAKAESVNHAALDALELVLANPATADAFGLLAGMAHLPPPLLATGVDVLKMIRQSAQPQPVAQPAPQPAGPVVAGQA